MSTTIDADGAPDPVRVLLVSGSVREPSHTRTLAEFVEQVLWNHEAATTHWSLCAQPLPIADPDHHDDPRTHTNEIVRQLVSAAELADAFALCSPIYHNSYSGVLKNALDNLAIAQFQYKPVGLLSHGSNRSPQAVDHLRIVVRGLRGVAIPSQVCTARRDYRPSASGGYELDSEDILHRIERFAAELMFFAYQLRVARQAVVATGR
jgi:azobenzene reductase